MPQYVGLDQTGFLEPYKILQAGLSQWANRRQQQKQFNQEQQFRERGFGLDEGREKRAAETDVLQRQMLQKQIERLTPKSFTPPAGTRMKGMSVDEMGNPTTQYERLPDLPTVPQGLVPKKFTTGSDGQSETSYGPKVTAPGTQIVQKPLPGGGTGLFRADVDPETGQEKLTPYSPRSEQETRVGNELMQKLNITAMALGQLPKFRAAVDSAGDAGGPIASMATRLPHALMGPSKERLTFDNLQAQSLAPMAKGILGETGALSEADMKRYAPLLPQFSDTQLVRRQKLAALEKLVGDQRSNILNNLQAAGYDTEKLSQTPGLSPAVTAPDTAGGEPPLIESQEQYNALPKGAQYRDSSGKVFTKK